MKTESLKQLIKESAELHRKFNYRNKKEIRFNIDMVARTLKERRND